MEIAPHDIVKIKEGVSMDSLSLPHWAQLIWNKTPFHVIRRAPINNNQIPIGIRGKQRGERFGCEVPISWIESVITPSQLVQNKRWLCWNRKDYFPEMMDTLIQLEMSLSSLNWGIGGSLGYELTSSYPTVKPSSDIDIIIYSPHKIDHELARTIYQSFQNSPTKVDFQVQNKLGAFHLQEYVEGKKKVLLKTVSGCLLTDNIWDIS